MASLENFKRKKKGKRGKKCQKVKRKKKGKKGKEEEEEVDECEPELEIDFDEILDKADEAQEEENEPADNELDPDPEDEEGYISPIEGNEDLGGEDAGDNDLRDKDETLPSLAALLSKQNKQPLSKQDEELQKAQLEKQQDLLFNDIIYFVLIEQFHSKKVICVLPNRFKKLYIIQLENNVGTRGMVIGGPHITDILPDLIGRDMITQYDRYDGSTPLDSALTDYRFVLFFDDPVNHTFFKWLDNSKQNVSFVDYLSMGRRGVIAAKYPFVHIRNTDVKDLLPSKTFNKRHVPTIVVNYLIYSNKPFKQEFYSIFDKYHGDAKYQGFFELFFNYYDEIMTNRLRLSPSTRLKGVTFQVETFQDSQRIQISLQTKLQSLQVISHVRNIFKEVKVDYTELQFAAKARVKVMDTIRLENQEHRSLNGDFYIVFISHRQNVCLLQSRVLLKQMKNLKTLQGDKVSCSHIDKHVALKLIAYDRVFLKNIDKPAVYIGHTNAYFFQVYDDEDDINHTYKCVSNPSILTQRACNSKYDGFGSLKPNGADIWDRPCYYDEECPFYGKGIYNKFRGGCQNGGYCEMPIGYTNVSYRYYTATPVGLELKSEDAGFRFYGDIFDKK